MVTENAITLIKNEGVLPYSLSDNNKITVFSDEKPRNDLIKNIFQLLLMTLLLRLICKIKL